MIFLTENINDSSENLDLNDILLENYELLLEAETTYNALEKELMLEEHNMIVNESILNEKVGLMKRFWEGVKTFFSKLWLIIKKVTRFIIGLYTGPVKKALAFLYKSYEGKEVTHLIEFTLITLIQDKGHAKTIEKKINNDKFLKNEAESSEFINTLHNDLLSYNEYIENIKQSETKTKMKAAKMAFKSYQKTIKETHEYSELIEKLIDRRIKMYESDKEETHTIEINTLKSLASYWNSYLTKFAKDSKFFLDNFNNALRNN